MSDGLTFTIEWAIPEEQWAKAELASKEHAPGSPYDRNALGRYYLLYGDVDFVFDGVPLYGAIYGINGVNISLFDLANAIADAYLKQRFSAGASTTYDQLDDDLHINVAGESDVIRVRASDRTVDLVVPRDVFMRGIVAFLCGVAAEVRSRIGGTLEWESMAPLREVAGQVCGN